MFFTTFTIFFDIHLYNINTLSNVDYHKIRGIRRKRLKSLMPISPWVYLAKNSTDQLAVLFD